MEKVDSRTTVPIRVPPELKVQLTEAAKDRSMTFNALVTQLLKEGLEDLLPASQLRLTRRG